jgi:hypothetical protein
MYDPAFALYDTDPEHGSQIVPTPLRIHPHNVHVQRWPETLPKNCLVYRRMIWSTGGAVFDTLLVSYPNRKVGVNDMTTKRGGPPCTTKPYLAQYNASYFPPIGTSFKCSV